MKRRYVCFGLMRLVGAVGFTIVGLGTLYLGAKCFGVELDSSASLRAVSAKGRGLLIASIVAGLAGGLVGQGIGCAIPISNKTADRVICFLWHSLANGGIVWVTLSAMSLGTLFRGVHAEAWVRAYGMYKLSAIMVVYSVIAGLTVGILHFVWGRRLAACSDDDLSVFVPWGLSFLFAAALGIVQARELGVRVWTGLVPGLAFPLVFVPITTHTLLRDEGLREELVPQQEHHDQSG